MSRPTAGATVCAAAFVVLACGRTPNDHVVVDTPLGTAFAGCGSVIEGPVCLLSARRTVQLWTSASRSNRFEAELLGRSVPVETRAVQGGTQITVKVPAVKSIAMLELRAHEAGRSQLFRLRVGMDRPDESIEQVSRLRARGDFEAAETALGAALHSEEPARRGRALGWKGRIAISRGDSDRAIDSLARSLSLLHAAGRISETVDNAVTLAYVAREHWKFDEALAALESADPLLAQFPEGRARVAYHRGLLARDLSDLREASEQLEEAMRWSERLAMDRLRRDVTQVQGGVLQRLGRADEAIQKLIPLEGELSRTGHPCERADLASNIGWLQRWRHESEPPWKHPSGATDPDSAADPRPHLERALRLYRRECVRADSERSTLVHLALAALERNEVLQAKRWLEEARNLSPERHSRIAAWLLELEGRIALRERRPEAALRAYDELGVRAHAAFAPALEWQAAVGRGLAFEALERWSQAVEAYGAAESHLDEAHRRIPVDQDPDVFAGEREESARRLVDLLVRQRETKKAVSIARKARVRALRRIAQRHRLSDLTREQRDRWRAALVAYQRGRKNLIEAESEAWHLSVDALKAREATYEKEQAKLLSLLDQALGVLRESEGTSTLPSPLDGELLLTYFPGPEGWIGFAETVADVRAMRLGGFFDTLDRRAASRQLITPFLPEIVRAKRLRILAYGPLRKLDFHALDANEAPLLATTPLVYGLDIAANDSDRATANHALVVSDPTRDLPRASREGSLARDALAASGFHVRFLAGDAASRERVHAALGHATWFHYAGHGKFAGRGAWDSRLPLAGDVAFTVGDILLLLAVPSTVVLLGCETARSADEAPAESLSLATAFVLAGSDTVLAATRPVPDPLTLELARLVYSSKRNEAEPWKRFTDSLLALSKQLPQADWASYRVLVR